MSSLLLVTISLLLLAIFFSLPLASSLATAAQWQASTPQGMLMEDKIRLGSTPPSCRNRCNACNPCMAVQVPTLPGGIGTVRPAATIPLDKSRTMAAATREGHHPLDVHGGANKVQRASAAPSTPLDVGVDSAPYRSYPYYKPLGWKCRCGNRLFNP